MTVKNGVTLKSVKVRQILLSRGMRQKDLASAVGVKVQTINGMLRSAESGWRIYRKTALRIAIALNVPIEEITNNWEPSEKRCPSCGKTKPISEFAHEKNSRDGRDHRCRECNAQRLREYRAKRAEQGNPYHAGRPDKRRNYQRRAHKVLEEAVASGKVVKPDTCSQCGGFFNRLDAHHDDYSKPLEVRWLCRSCHLLHHAKLRRKQKEQIIEVFGQEATA